MKKIAGQAATNRMLARAASFSLLAACATAAFADKELADRNPSVSAVTLESLPALGSVPTVYVNIDPFTLADLLRQDREQGRRLWDKNRPSHIEAHIIKQKHLPIGNSSANGFSQGNPYLCITSVLVSVPAWNNPATVPSSYDKPVVASRACSANQPNVPVARGSAAINTLLSNFGVHIGANTTHKVYFLKPTSQAPSAVNANPEPTTSWGMAFFDTNGNTGKLQEVVWVDGTYNNVN